MAEFCKKCFEKMDGDLIAKNEKIILSEDGDLCEGCGGWKSIVIEIVEK